MPELSNQSFSFADGNAGHVCALGAPNAGETDLLFVNSNTVVSTPSGFTLRATRVINQGSYIFSRKASGGESANVTITTAGDHNTQVTHRRWSGLDAFDVSAVAGADTSSNTLTPAATTAALAASTEVSFVLAALHSVGGAANQSAPVWSDVAYGNSTTAKQGTGATGVVGFTAYKSPAGTAAESVGCASWTGDGAQNRYTLVATFTTTAAGETGMLAAVLPLLQGSFVGAVAQPATLALPLPLPTLALQGGPTPTGVLALVLPLPQLALVGAVQPVGELTMMLPRLGLALIGAVEGAAAAGGSWWSLDVIARERRLYLEQDRTQPPTACWRCGEPLRPDAAGRPTCPFDGWRPPEW